MSHLFAVLAHFAWRFCAIVGATWRYWGVFFLALLLALLLTPPCRDLAHRLGMVDQPGPRRINKTPVPRAGGLAVFFAANLALVGLVLLTGRDVCAVFPVPLMLRLVTLAGCLVALGLADDKWSLHPLVKLAGQVTVAFAAFAWCGVSFRTLVPWLPVWADAAATVFWIVGAINAFNLIDGLDGLAAGLALIAALGMSGALFFLGVPANMLPYLALAGACLGFLRYNFNPASVFLGDTGSMFLGFFLATMPLLTQTADSLFVSLGVPLLAMGVPIFDTSLAIIRRSVRALLKIEEHGAAEGQTRVMGADADHLHHRLLRTTLSQKSAARALYLLAIFLVVVGLGGVLLKNRATGLFIVAFLVAAVVVVRDMERVELWDVGRLLADVDRNRDPRRLRLRTALIVPLQIVYDIASLVVVWALAQILLRHPISARAFHVGVPVFVVPVFFALVLAGVYRTVWSRAQVSDFAAVVGAAFAGSAVSLAAIILFGLDVPGRAPLAFIYASLAVFPLVGVRLLRETVRDGFYALERIRLASDPAVQNLLVYGAGLRFRAFRRELVRSTGRNRRIIVGILDDDPALRGRRVAGIPVVGSLADAESAVRDLSVDAVVIACQQDSARREVAVRLFRRLGLVVTLWSCEETVLAFAPPPPASSSTPNSKKKE